MDERCKIQVVVEPQADTMPIELQELPHSPKFPRAAPTPDPHHLTSHTSVSTASEEGNDSGVGLTGSSDKSKKQWLNFRPLDFLDLGKSKKSENNSGSSSPVLKSPADGWKMDISSTGDAQIEKADKVFTVAAKDRSMLERIAQRAHERSLRVRQPHEVFVELEEIRMDHSEELEWTETARWIKFEEEVEEGSGRWGRPHISALAFHSLVVLQQGLDKGCCLLDVEAHSFPQLVEEVVQALVSSERIEASAREQVRMLLLKRHKHSSDTSLWDKIRNSAKDGTLHQIGEGIRRMSSSDFDSHSGSRRGSHDHTPHTTSHTHTQGNGHGKPTAFSSLPLLVEESEEVSPGPPSDKSTPDSHPDPPPPSSRKVSFSLGGTTGVHANSSDNVALDKEMEDVTGSSGTSRLHKRRRGSSVLSKIPDEAESLTVLVGGVKFLKEPVAVFVRLQNALPDHHGDLVEAPVPLRFLFLQIGPSDDTVDYHEVGRAMATLMSDAHFHEVAYSADSKDDLLGAMGEFLDSSLVLPPGDWDEELLLPALHERNNLRRRKEDHKDAVVKYQKMVVEPIKHSRRPCGGIWNDLKKLASRYRSDFTDALKPQVFYSIIFIYISFVAPAIAFGGLMEEVTGNLIGETETLLATGLGGIFYGLFSLQPLTVLAFTGPVIVFESIIFEFSRDYFDLPYLEWRAAIGLWVLMFLVILAVTELTFLAHHFTRFSEEIFTGVVAFFFIYECGLSLFHIFERNPLCGINYPCGEAAHLTNTCMPLDDHHDDNLSNDSHASGSGYGSLEGGSGAYMYGTMTTNHSSGNETAPVPMLPRGFRICNQPNTFLWSLILCLSTFFIAFLLRKLRYKNFLGKQIRRLVSDFGMLVAITVTVLVAFAMRNLIAVEGLLVLPGFSVSSPNVRGWFINPFNGRLSIGAGIGAVVPGALLAVLIFVENQLTLILINKPEHKLRKPVGYHVDLALVGVLSGLSGLLGMPFLCGAPIRSLQHLQALSVYVKHHAPGEKPKLLKIHEQRVTTLVVHTLILFTSFAAVVLETIPIAVVLGVFLYLSYASIVGVQLFSRIKLLFVHPKHYPDVIYVNKVRTWKMHLYTLIQVLCVGVLFGVKNSPAALAYPLIIVLLIPLRWVLGKTLYNQEEIEALDNEENAKADKGEIGEFELSHVPY